MIKKMKEKFTIEYVEHAFEIEIDVQDLKQSAKNARLRRPYSNSLNLQNIRLLTKQAEERVAKAKAALEVFYDIDCPADEGDIKQLEVAFKEAKAEDYAALVALFYQQMLHLLFLDPLELLKIFREQHPEALERCNTERKFYELHEHGLAREDFKRVFNADFRAFHGNTISLICGRIILDICGFDAYLYKKYNDYKQGGESLNDFVTRKFGADGIELLNILTNIE